MDENLAKIRHERSKKDFPEVKFEEGEYIEYALYRTKTYLMAIIISVTIGIVLVLLIFLFILMDQSDLDEMGKNFLLMIMFTFLAVVIVMSATYIKVYNGNKLFITNRRVIQMVKESLVSNSTNIIDLASLEDASFSQGSLLQKILNYGTFRLSTVGDETTYTFKYSNMSSDELDGITRLIMNAKKKRENDKS